MTHTDIERYVANFFATSPLNTISHMQALDADCAGITIFDAPIVAYGSAQDSLFTTFKEQVLGPHFRLPSEWLPTAKTVISIFAPLSKEIVLSNGVDTLYPSNLWLHGRYEGQQCLVALAKELQALLHEKSYKSCCPCISPDFMAVHEGEGLCFTSNWSERHVAFLCGIGTFSLAKTIISEKGMAGRLISLVTELDIPKTQRAYTDIYEYCILCGACIARCPVRAISFEKGKEHIPCSRFLDEVLLKQNPRYACGKCQTKVPCSRQKPQKNTKQRKERDMAKKDMVLQSQHSIDIKIYALIMCVAHEMEAQTNAMLKKHGLSRTQLHILDVLDSATTQAMTVKEIKERMYDESPNVSRSLNKLMDNGYIVKERVVEDQRIVRVRITDAGKKVHLDADMAILAEGKQFPLSEEEKELFFTLLKKF